MKQRIIIIFLLLFFGYAASAWACKYKSEILSKMTSADVSTPDLSAIFSGGSSFFTGPGMDSYTHYKVGVFSLTFYSMDGKNLMLIFNKIWLFSIKDPLVPNLFADVAGKDDTIDTMMDDTGGTGQNSGIGEGEIPTMEGSQQVEETSGEVRDEVTPSPVPEPATLFLLGVGLLGAGWYSRKKPAQG